MSYEKLGLKGVLSPVARAYDSIAFMVNYFSSDSRRKRAFREQRRFARSLDFSVKRTPVLADDSEKVSHLEAQLADSNANYVALKKETDRLEGAYAETLGKYLDLQKLLARVRSEQLATEDFKTLEALILDHPRILNEVISKQVVDQANALLPLEKYAREVVGQDVEDVGEFFSSYVRALRVVLDEGDKERSYVAFTSKREPYLVFPGELLDEQIPEVLALARGEVPYEGKLGRYQLKISKTSNDPSLLEIQLSKPSMLSRLAYATKNAFAHKDSSQKSQEIKE